jgi:predicted ATPase
MFKPSHLTDEATNFLSRGLDERVYFVRSKRWIAYPKAVQILDHLNKMLRHPRTTRMPSLVVYGDSGMGKSMLVDKFKSDCAAGSETDTAPNRNKVLVVEMSGRPTERRLYSQILAAVDAPHSPRASIVDVERGALNILRDIGVQILVIDESTISSRGPGANNGSS